MRMTAHEVTLVVVVLMALVVGAAVKHYRDKQRAASAVTAPAGPLPGVR
jgi:hypothetical protein